MLPSLRHAPSLLSLLALHAFAHAQEPLPPDRIALEFADAKLAKTFQLTTNLSGTKFSEGFEYGPGQFAAVVESSQPDAFGVVETPIVGRGTYQVDLTLGFLGTEGLVPTDGPEGGAAQAGVEIDRVGSNPLDFYFLGIFWAQNQLWAYAANRQGSIGSPLALGPTLWAALRIVQTQSAIEFYARAYKAQSFALVASLAVSPWAELFRCGFGASNLGRGAKVAFAALLASGALFDPVALPFVLQLANQFYPEIAAIQCYLLFEPNLPLALTRLRLLLPLIDALRFGIDNEGRAGNFFQVVLWTAATKFLSSAYSTGMKAEQALARNDVAKALPSFFLMYAYLQLADLSLRGMAVRRAEELGYFRNFES
ncbi:MAG: hypothetical protein JNM84_28190 [Planctomycetes bacterium]|nr:hypothetical protein [Planctomycetota bacterium]